MKDHVERFHLVFCRLSGASLEGVDPNLTARYRLPPVIAPHYLADTACLQKIQALALRPETQARDVFDLDLLFPRTHDSLPVDAALLRQAQENALSISYADFKGQVWAFLEPAYQNDYDSEVIWEVILERVCARLEKMEAGHAP